MLLGSKINLQQSPVSHVWAPGSDDRLALLRGADGAEGGRAGLGGQGGLDPATRVEYLDLPPGFHPYL